MPLLTRTLALCLIGAVALPAAAQNLKIDGSSTVFPITDAVVRRYRKAYPQARVEVNFSGSSAGFRKLLAGEILISGASRPIKAKELAKAKAQGMEIVELPVAYDGLTVVVSKTNSFIDSLSVAELKRIWEPDSKITKWSQVRAGWPETAIKLFGPGGDSGTFDYFTSVICGKSGASRTDYVGSEDDVELVEGVVANSEGGLAYFGYAYYLENAAVLRAVPIGPKGSAVRPNDTTIRDGSYTPLSRPIFIYVRRSALEDPAIQRFVEFYLESLGEVVPKAGYFTLSDAANRLVRQRLADRRTGSLFSGKPPGISVEKTLAAGAGPGGSDPGTSDSSGSGSTDGSDAPVGKPTAEMTEAEYRRAVEELRDAALALSRKALDGRVTLAELDRQLRLLQLRLDELRARAGDRATLGGK